MGHIKLEMLMKHSNSNAEPMIWDEVRLGDIKLEFTSVCREFKDVFLEQSPRQQRYIEKKEA